MDKIVVYCATKNIYSDLKLSIQSLLHFNNPDKIICFINSDTVPNDMLNKNVEYINVSFVLSKFINKNNNHFTTMANFKVLLADMLPQYNKALYIDTDTCIDGNLDELFSLDLNNYYFGAVSGHITKFNAKYFNTGIMLLNLQKLRNDNIPERAFKLLNKCNYEYPDQDVLNLLCRNRIMELDTKYNSSACTKLLDNAIIQHFAGYIDKREAPNYKIKYKYMRRV